MYLKSFVKIVLLSWTLVHANANETLYGDHTTSSLSNVESRSVTQTRRSKQSNKSINSPTWNKYSRTLKKGKGKSKSKGKSKGKKSKASPPSFNPSTEPSTMFSSEPTIPIPICEPFEEPVPISDLSQLKQCSSNETQCDLTVRINQS